MSDDHAAAVRRAFSQQAAAFEDPRFNRIFTADVDWLLAHLDPGPGHLALDVAAGTGHVARRLAPAVRSVIALVASPAMLETGRAAAEGAGVRNVVCPRGESHFSLINALCRNNASIRAGSHPVQKAR